MKKRSFALAILFLGAVSVVASACEPPPPPPPERIELDVLLTTDVPLLGFGYDVRWNRHEFQIRARAGFEFCDPRIVAIEWTTDTIHEPLAPEDPELEGVMVDGWVLGSGGRAVFSVLNNRACWDEALWSQFGGHPYDVGWDLDVDMQLEQDGPYDKIAEFYELPRIAYQIVK